MISVLYIMIHIIVNLYLYCIYSVKLMKFFIGMFLDFIHITHLLLYSKLLKCNRNLKLIKLFIIIIDLKYMDMLKSGQYILWVKRLIYKIIKMILVLNYYQMNCLFKYIIIVICILYIIYYILYLYIISFYILKNHLL